MARPIYDKLAKMRKSKLDSLEYGHQQHLTRFSNAKEGKVSEVQSLDKKLTSMPRGMFRSTSGAGSMRF